MDDLSVVDKPKPKADETEHAVEVNSCCRGGSRSRVSWRSSQKSGQFPAEGSHSIRIVFDRKDRWNFTGADCGDHSKKDVPASTAIEIVLNTFQDFVDKPLIQTTLHFGKFFREMGSTAQ
jgi:hypothetical protein